MRVSPKITEEEVAAVKAFASEHGRCWKSELHMSWQKSTAGCVLQGLRNKLGPSWLALVRLKDLKPTPEAQ